MKNILFIVPFFFSFLIINAQEIECPDGYIADCNGNCAPETWGADDGYCDDIDYCIGSNPNNSMDYDSDGDTICDDVDPCEGETVFSPDGCVGDGFYFGDTCNYIFVDSDDRYQIDISKLKQSITKKTKVIMPVHWGGASPNMFLIKKIAEENNIDIIEDACMGIGALINKKSPGTFGKVNAFSMHPLKSLNVMGDGGMVVTNDDKLASWIRKYRNHGMIDRDNIAFWGVNMRLQPLQSIVAYKGIQKLDKIIKKRNYNAKILDKGLDILRPKVTIPKRPKKYLETFALYMILNLRRFVLLTISQQSDVNLIVKLLLLN